jgi:hypothetical protein
MNTVSVHGGELLEAITTRAYSKLLADNYYIFTNKCRYLSIKGTRRERNNWLYI